MPERVLRSSRLPRSAPGEWKETEALRECVLLIYPESHARMLRAVFPALATIYGEEYAGGDRKYCGSYIKGELRAAMQDLRYTARFLAMVACTGIDEETEADQRLARFADELAMQVEELADLVEKRIVPARKRGAVESS